MNTFIQNNINFTIKDKSLYNESKHVIDGKVSSIKNDYENYSNDNNSYLINAIDIDWNDSELEYAKISNDINTLIDDNYTNVHVNTTGEFLDLLDSMSEKINYIKGKYNELYPLIMRRIVISKNENVLSATLLGEPFSVNWTSSNPNIKFADPSIPIYVGHDTYETYTGTSVRIEYRGEARKGGKFTIEPKSDIVYYPDSIICNIIWTGTEFNETTLITASKDTYISASLDCSLTIYGSSNMTSKKLSISAEHVNTSGLDETRLLFWPIGHNWSLNKNYCWHNIEIPYRFTEETDNDGELIDNIFKINLNSTEFTDNVYVTVVPLIHQYLTFTAVEDSTFKLISLNTSFEQQDYPYINYSLDNGESWNKLDLDTETPIIESGKKIMWSADFSTPENLGYGRWLEYSPGYVGNFISSAKFNVSGNIYSIIYGHQFKGHYDYDRNNYRFYSLFKDSKVVNASNLILPAITLAGGCYSHMFYNCTSLTSAPELPATTLATECYKSMFSGCTSLTTAPALPATTLAENCYQYMFSGCTNLTSAPALPAITLATYCYNNMFKGCTNLITAPELPATTLAKNCYDSMFWNCKSLMTAPALPATTLTNSCYLSMFEGCTSLTSAPSILPATTLAKMCYYYMFANCTSLTTAPELPATTLVERCYSHMFADCTSLTSTPSILPATTLADYCYKYMFYRCTSLTTAPALPATTLAEDCYFSMFSGCTRLTSAPELPATILAENCYRMMFADCTSLTTAPVLPATLLVSNCYNYMFSGCSSLNYIKALFITTPSTLYTSNWVNGVANSGTFIKSSKATWNNTFNSSCIPLNDTYKWAVEYDEIIWKNQYLTLTALEDNTTFAFRNAYISCSTDNGSSWFEVAGPNTSQTIATINTGQTILFKGTETPTSSNGIGTFSSDKPFNASGNVMSLLYGDNFRNQTSLSGKNYAFYNLFNNSKVVDASNLILPATTLVERCYHSMFHGCKSLTSAPELPAETLASHCCNSMFSYCTSLTSAPELSATTLADYCYYGIFEVCTSLTTAPELPATTLATGCYKEMFYNCTNLTSAPTLPATTLVNKCYEEMFALCSSLNYIKAAFITVPDESYTGSWVYRVANSGTFVKNYKAKWPNKYDENNIPLNDTYPWGVITWDFENDIEIILKDQYLTLTALEDDTTFKFNKNSNSNINLSYSIDGKNWTPITTSNPTTTSVSKDTTIMFKGTGNPASSNGIGTFSSNNKTFNISGNIMSLLYGDNFRNQTSLSGKDYVFSRLFNNSKVIDASNLVLPATTLADYCYFSMFYGCTSLTSAPSILPATTLTSGCYIHMFRLCLSLTSAPTLPATTLAEDCYCYMFQGCSSLTSAPELPATTLAEDCYKIMFGGCFSLTSAPALPATTLASDCYNQMFSDCTSLTTAPELPATTLVNNCYRYMFFNCSQLNYIKAAFTTTPSTSYTANWVYGVASSGIFDQIGNVTWEIYGNNAIPTNWKLYRNGQPTVIEIHLQINVSQSTGQSSDWRNFLSNNPGLKEIYAQIGSTYVLLSSNPSSNSNFISGVLPGITVDKQYENQTINRFNLVYTASNGQSRTYTCTRIDSWPARLRIGSSSYSLTI